MLASFPSGFVSSCSVSCCFILLSWFTVHLTFKPTWTFQTFSTEVPSASTLTLTPSLAVAETTNQFATAGKAQGLAGSNRFKQAAKAREPREIKSAGEINAYTTYDVKFDWFFWASVKICILIFVDQLNISYNSAGQQLQLTTKQNKKQLNILSVCCG